MANKTKESQLRANAKYKAANIKTFSVQFNKTADSDIIDFINSQENKQGFLKDLIRQAMAER